MIFNPVKNKIRTRLGERNGLAALMTIVIICLIVFTPLAIILSSLAYELNLVYSKLQHNDTQFPTVVASLFALPGMRRGYQRMAKWIDGIAGTLFAGFGIHLIISR